MRRSCGEPRKDRRLKGGVGRDEAHWRVLRVKICVTWERAPWKNLEGSLLKMRGQRSSCRNQKRFQGLKGDVAETHGELAEGKRALFRRLRKT